MPVSCGYGWFTWRSHGPGVSSRFALAASRRGPQRPCSWRSIYRPARVVGNLPDPTTDTDRLVPCRAESITIRDGNVTNRCYASAERLNTIQSSVSLRLKSFMETTANTPARIQVFWQPGCSSCLRTKEFLTKQGIEFESINVHHNPEGMAKLQALGARSVPVVALGGRYTLCQTFADVIKFLDLKKIGRAHV